MPPPKPSHPPFIPPFLNFEMGGQRGVGMGEGILKNYANRKK
jgi:hypothetical protein